MLVQRSGDHFSPCSFGRAQLASVWSIMPHRCRWQMPLRTSLARDITTRHTLTYSYTDLRHPSPANKCLPLLIMTQHLEPEFLILVAGVRLEMIRSWKVSCFCAEGGEASHAAPSLSLYFFDPIYTSYFHFILCQLLLHSNYLFLLSVFFLSISAAQ